MGSSRVREYLGVMGIVENMNKVYYMKNIIKKSLNLMIFINSLLKHKDTLTGSRSHNIRTCERGRIEIESYYHIPFSFLMRFLGEILRYYSK